ncbi:MAG TPA: carboxypeptidase-like regulatory domain-containing protein [Bryobacteraceae bacterium]|nr:carboxypeptidase-like regulatory domain-containing protein [Bryobacteraceae bacterium]
MSLYPRGAWLLALVALTLTQAPLNSQTTFASITGVVTDASGSAVPSARIVATNIETNIAVQSASNESGNYTIPQLQQGTYNVRVIAPGFKAFTAANVTLTARDIRRIDVSLEVGSVDTSVEVKADAALIETETARISDTKDANLMKTLPLNTRSAWAFLALSPNVLQSGGGSSTIRFAGSRSNQSNWAIDGITMADGVDNTQIGPLLNFIESFEEMKIDMANNTAEFGAIGQVTMISKSGTNQLHGNVFDYYQSPWFRARNPFALVRGSGVSHTPGGSIGGPVVLPKIYNGRNKTFFFGSYETSKGSLLTDNFNPTVPLAAWRQGDFSGLPAGMLIYDPLTGMPFPGNRIPANRINSVSRAIQERFYPLPNFGSTGVFASQNFRSQDTRPRDPVKYWTARGDHRFSNADAIYGRYTYYQAQNNTFEGNLPAIGRRFQQRDNRAAIVSHTHMFSPTLLNEIRWGYALNNNPVEGPINGPRLVSELGLVGLAGDLPNISGLLKVNWVGIGLQPVTQPDYTRPGFRNHLEQIQDHVSWSRGKHNLKTGFELTRVAYDSLNASANLFGSVDFSNRFTSAGQANQGHPYADFLLGIPTSASRAFAPVEVDRFRWQYDFFVADDWKVSQKLTLNVGMRYELHQPWKEKNQLTSLFDIGTGKIVVEDGALAKVSPLFPRSYVGVVEASTVGLPGRTLVRTDRNNLATRVGAAYRPFGNKTVFRSGFGIFYDVVPRQLSQGGIPFVLNEPAYTNPATNPDVIFPRVFPSTGAGGPATVGLPAAVNPNLPIPYSMQYSFTVEHQQWDTGFRLSYIGTNTRQGEYGYNYNSPVPDTRAFVDKSRPFPNYPGITYITNGAGHQYNGLTTEVERRFAQGLYLQGSWVWARDIGDMNRGEILENPFDRQRERAVISDIPTHRTNVNFIYQLPFGKGRRLLSNASRWTNLAVGGWEFSGVHSYYSGQFLTPLWSGPDPTGTAYTTSRTPANVTIRPDHLRDATLPESDRSVNRWFDAGAFGAPQAGRFGTAAKGTIKGPDVNVWHAGLYKSFTFGERAPRLRWELTATNLLNHQNFSNPQVNITQAANVGVITGVGGVNGSSTGDLPGARSMRMGLRLEW